MSDDFPTESKHFIATVALSPSDLGLYSALRQVKKISNDETVSAMVAFCLQVLAGEFSTLSAEGRLGEDLDRANFTFTAQKKQFGLIMAGAEKVLLDTSALREQLSRQVAEWT